VKPQLFVLKPVSEYGYRLVLDVYPAYPVDPLMALLEQAKATTQNSQRTRCDRPTTIYRGQTICNSGRRFHQATVACYFAPKVP